MRKCFLIVSVAMLAMAMGLLVGPCMAQSPTATPSPTTYDPATSLKVGPDVTGQGVVADHAMVPVLLPDAAADQPGYANLSVHPEYAPEGAIVTDLVFSSRVAHDYLGDLVIMLGNDQGTELVLWDRQGGANDAGLDDDIATDADMEVLHRLISDEFRGDLVRQGWYLRAWDHVPENTGLLDVLEIELYYASGQIAQPWVASYGIHAGGWTDQDTFPRMLGDVNGDNLADLVGFGNRAVYVSLSTGDSFATPEPWLLGLGPASGGWTSQSLYPRCCGDVDGDGLADIVAFGNRAVYVSLSQGTHFSAPQPWHYGYGVSAGGWTDQNAFPRMVGDVNGDGVADVVGCGNAGAYVSLSTKSAFTEPELWIANYGRSAGAWYSQDLYPRMLADINDDGFADLVGFGNRAVYVSCSTGNGFESPVEAIACYGPSAGGWSTQNAFPRMLADMDADGDADIVGFGSAGAYASRSLGARHGQPWIWLSQFGQAAGGWTSQDAYPRMLGDVDGDGMADIVGCGNRATYVALTH